MEKDNLFLGPEQYKELDGLMTYILDEMWGTDDKEMIREGIIAYANKWHEFQMGAIEQSKKKMNKFIAEAIEYAKSGGMVPPFFLASTFKIDMKHEDIQHCFLIPGKEGDILVGQMKDLEINEAYKDYEKEMRRYSPDEYRRMVMNEPLPPQPPESL